ncbi:alpha/beta fold hydrolase [Kitasatospora sp. NBC_01539]|uniref:alpha/beta fold hydrolase n=1 Tax=Kitasatospora sp. NBC_01539 TaxID=2903577 RepID=UPI0038602D12
MTAGTGSVREGSGRLDVHRAAGEPCGAVLLLHGGRADGLAPPPRVGLAALRMRPFRAAILRGLGDRPVIAASVRYRHRGWNGRHAHAAADARAALDELAPLLGDAPVVLVGHSMGGRAALAAAGHPLVAGVVALAPWCRPDDGTAHLRGRALALLHDERDRVTDARATWVFGARAAGAGARVRAVAMPRGGHTMLRDARRWHRLTAEFAVAILDGRPLPSPPGTLGIDP